MGTPQDSRRSILSLRGMALRFAIVTFTAVSLAGCQSNPQKELTTKYKKIRLDMTEDQVDQILAGYPSERRELAESDKEAPLTFVTHFKLNRKGSFVKTYDCELADNAGHFFIEVYFDDNHTVVG